jgi:hypothetical protein
MRLIAAADTAPDAVTSLAASTASSTRPETEWQSWADNFAAPACSLNALTVLGCRRPHPRKEATAADAAAGVLPDVRAFNRHLLESPRAFRFQNTPVGAHAAFMLACQSLDDLLLLPAAAAGFSDAGAPRLSWESLCASGTALWCASVGGRPAPAQLPIIAMNAVAHVADWAALALGATDLARVDRLRFLDGAPLPLPKLPPPPPPAGGTTTTAPPTQRQRQLAMDGRLWADWFAARSRAIIDDDVFAGPWRGYRSAGVALSSEFVARQPASDDVGRLREIRFERRDVHADAHAHADTTPRRSPGALIRIRGSGRDSAGPVELTGEINRETRTVMLYCLSAVAAPTPEAAAGSTAPPPPREARCTGMVTPFGMSGYGSSGGVGCVDEFWWFYKDEWVA